MQQRGIFGLGGAALGLLGIALFSIVSCSGDRSGDGSGAQTPDASAPPAVVAALSTAARHRTPPTEPNYFAGPPDSSQSVIQRDPLVDVALPGSSRPFRDLPNATRADGAGERPEHEPGRNPFAFPAHAEPDHVLQSDLPIASMPVTLQSFLGQGTTLGGCIFPKPDGGEPAGCTTRGDPPDTVGAVGPNHYVQAINSGIAIWNKSGAIVQAPKYTSTLWTNHPTTDGNKCGATPAQGGDWGDAVVLYDQLADRWFITQFDITNGVANNVGPSYQCVAVSKTGDPTGEYWTYDFQYATAINDYGKFSVWPDAYYASFNNFNPGFTGASLCAYDRASMLTGAPATQQCFNNAGFGFLPGNADGSVSPPRGEPAFFLTLRGGNSLGLYKFRVNWTTPASSTFTGPTALPVAAFNQLCGGSTCVPQPAPGNALGSLADRLMFRLVYRNFGTHEALFANHSVTANGAGGVRWYEIRSPNGTPTVFQQGTYAPNDGSYRWMGSIAQDQAQGVAIGYTVSSASVQPSIAWAGRIASDPAGSMGQAETVVQPGAGVETGNFSNGQAASRWGDYSNMTVDPTDDCTFWYTTEVYPSNGIFNYDTHVSSVKFPNCAANDFSLAVAPATQSIQQGKTVAYTVTTASTRGTAESIALNIQDLPAGVSGAFAPASVTAGATSTLTLTATAAAPLTASPVTFTVIGKAPSAVHAATAQVSVITPVTGNCGNGTLDPGEQCDVGAGNGTPSSCCSSTCQFRPTTFVCRPAANACDAPESCTGSAAACPADGSVANGTPCPDGTVCNGAETCQAGVCTAGSPLDCNDNNVCTTDACDPTAGCKHANVANGSACSTNNKCTTGDSCQSGTCAAGTAKTCAALDECHDVGTCDTTTGNCSNPAKSDGTACSVGTCRGGTCAASAADAGVDSGADTDSGVDAGGGRDAGTARDAGRDSGGSSADAAAEAGDPGGTGDSGGCGCRTVAADRTPSWAVFGVLGAAFGALRLRRRARRAPR